MFLKKCEDVKLGFEEADVNAADSGWLLAVLSTLNPGHMFFAKSFYPQPSMLNNAKELESALNEDEFFDDLPDVQHVNKFKAKKLQRTMFAKQEKGFQMHPDVKRKNENL